MVSVTLRSLSAPEVIDAVGKTGLRGIEWGGDVHVLPDRPIIAKEVRLRMEDAGLQTSAYGSYYKFGDASGLPEVGPRFSEVLETAVNLGTGMIRVWASVMGSNQASVEHRKALVRRCAEIVNEANDAGVRIGFEFHSDTLADSPESANWILDEVDSHNLSTFWQTPLQLSVEKRREGLRQLLPRVSNIHCNYFDQNPWPGALPLADGKNEWDAYLSDLEKTGREHWLSIEFVKDGHIEQFAQDAEALKSWL